MFKLNLEDIYVDAFNIQTFNRNGNESAILKIKYHIPPDPIIQHVPSEEKVGKVEVNQLRNGYIADVLTSVHIQEIVKKGGRVFAIYEGVIYIVI